MRRLAAFAIVPLLLATTSGCASIQKPDSDVLPLERVRLYESGVAYYERSGEVSTKGARLPVPASHLDDAIKTLVVLGAGGTVQHIAFDSHLGLAVARARAGLPPDVDAEVGLDEILQSLRGAEVVLRARVQSTSQPGKDGKPPSTRTLEHRGKLVDVVRVSANDPTWDGPRPESAEESTNARQVQVVLYTKAGEFRRFDLRDIRSVAPLDPELRKRYESALDTHASRRSGAQDSLSIVGTDRGPVTLGYLAETPVWRTTFRLVFSDEVDAGHIQGWALVHNDTDEDWSKVALELVNGRPDSFLFPLAAPRYERRALETPPDPLSSVPQLLTTTPDIMWGDFSDLGYGTAGGGTGSGYGSGSGAGFGGRSKRVPRVRQAQAKVTTGGSNLLALGDLAKLAGASGEETQTQFVYRAGEALDLGAHQSAMVPFMDADVTASPVVWFQTFGDGARHGVRMVNSTRQTLPEGPVSVYASGGFSGESFLMRLKPGQRQFLHIGDDPDTELTVDDTKVVEELQRLAYRNDDLEEHFLKTTTRKIRFFNRSGTKREVLVVLPIGRNSKVDGAEVDFDSARGLVLAVFHVEPGKGEVQTLVTVEALSRMHPTSTLDTGVLERLEADTRLEQVERDAVKEAHAKLQKVVDAQVRLTEVDEEIGTVEADLERLRGHLQALGDKQSAGKTNNPIVTRLLAAEDVLTRLRKDRRAAERVVEDARVKVRETLEVLRPQD